MIHDALWLVLLFTGLFAGILSGMPVMLVLAGVPMLIAAIAALAGSFDIVLLQALPQRIYGIMNNGIFVAVPLFVLMGVLLEKSRVAERMLLHFGTLLGGSPSALTLSVLFASVLIAASTGVIGATIVMLTLVALPALLRSGVAPPLASGLVCASGTLGQIIPPSIVLVLLGDQISSAHAEAQRNLGNFAPEPVSVGDLFAGALLPGLVLVALYAAYCLFILVLSPVQGKDVTQESPHPTERGGKLAWGGLLADLLPPFLLILAVLGSILAGVATPTEAAAVGAGGTLLLTAARGNPRDRLRQIGYGIAAFGAICLVAGRSVGLEPMQTQNGPDPAFVVTVFLAVPILLGLASAAFDGWRSGTLPGAMRETVQICSMIFGIVIAASVMSLVFRGFGGDAIVERMLNGMPGDRWGMLLVTMLVIFVLGFVLEFVEIVFIVIPIVGPIILSAGFDPVWFAVLVALNLQTSFLTPPFGFALFYFRSVAPPSVPTAILYRAIIPFVLIQLTALGIVATFPALATWLPARLF